jgi:hypothetical protein
MEQIELERAEWLKAHDRREADVMWEEEDGREFIITDETEGQDDEGNVVIQTK